MSPPRLNLVGAGRVGRTLAALWSRAGAVRVGGVLTRAPAHTADAMAFIGSGTAVESLAGLPPADFTLVATPDDVLEDIGSALFAGASLLPGSIIFHCSGALSSSVLGSAPGVPVHRASLHPVASFGDPARLVHSFAGTPCGLEGDPIAVVRLTELCRAVGAEPFEVAAADKLVYHAAAVFASNYLTTVLGAAEESYRAIGMEPRLQGRLIAALAQGTLANVVNQGAFASLTGPIARGDASLVARELAELEARLPLVAQLYRALVPATARLAGRPDPLAKNA